MQDTAHCRCRLFFSPRLPLICLPSGLTVLGVSFCCPPSLLNHPRCIEIWPGPNNPVIAPMPRHSTAMQILNEAIILPPGSAMRVPTTGPEQAVLLVSRSVNAENAGLRERAMFSFSFYTGNFAFFLASTPQALFPSLQIPLSPQDSFLNTWACDFSEVLWRFLSFSRRSFKCNG